MAKLKILVLGGTQLLGRDFIEETCNTYDITIANRGLTNSYLFPEIKHLKLDRNIEHTCSQLQYHEYDYILDFSCYTLQQFLNITKYIKYNIKYIYISTMSVFDKKTIEKKDINDNYYWYCINKSDIEQYILNKYIDKILIVRPCAIYGENDYTNRFYKQNNIFYHTNTNQQVNDEDGYMYIKDFTKKLINIIFNDTNYTTVNILK